MQFKNQKHDIARNIEAWKKNIGKDEPKRRQTSDR